MPSNSRFEEPHAGLAESYRALVAEFRAAGEDLVPFVLGFPNELVCDGARSNAVADVSAEYFAEHDEVVQRYRIELRQH